MHLGNALPERRSVPPSTLEALPERRSVPPSTLEALPERRVGPTSTSGGAVFDAADGELNPLVQQQLSEVDWVAVPALLLEAAIDHLFSTSSTTSRGDDAHVQRAASASGDAASSSLGARTSTSQLQTADYARAAAQPSHVVNFAVATALADAELVALRQRVHQLEAHLRVVVHASSALLLHQSGTSQALAEPSPPPLAYPYNQQQAQMLSALPPSPASLLNTTGRIPSSSSLDSGDGVFASLELLPLTMAPLPRVEFPPGLPGLTSATTSVASNNNGYIPPSLTGLSSTTTTTATGGAAVASNAAVANKSAVTRNSAAASTAAVTKAWDNSNNNNDNSDEDEYGGDGVRVCSMCGTANAPSAGATPSLSLSLSGGVADDNDDDDGDERSGSGGGTEHRSSTSTLMRRGTEHQFLCPDCSRIESWVGSCLDE